MKDGREKQPFISMRCLFDVQSTENVCRDSQRKCCSINSCLYYLVTCISFHETYLNPVLTAGKCSCSSANIASNIPYMHAFILDCPAPMPALSVLFITSLASNGICALPEWLLECCESHTLLGMSKNTLQATGAMFLHRNYISADLYSRHCANGNKLKSVCHVIKYFALS